MGRGGLWRCGDGISCLLKERLRVCMGSFVVMVSLGCYIIKDFSLYLMLLGLFAIKLLPINNVKVMLYV